MDIIVIHYLDYSTPLFMGDSPICVCLKIGSPNNSGVDHHVLHYRGYCRRKLQFQTHSNIISSWLVVSITIPILL